MLDQSDLLLWVLWADRPLTSKLNINQNIALSALWGTRKSFDQKNNNSAPYNPESLRYVVFTDVKVILKGAKRFVEVFVWLGG